MTPSAEQLAAWDEAYPALKASAECIARHFVRGGCRITAAELAQEALSAMWVWLPNHDVQFKLVTMGRLKIKGAMIDLMRRRRIKFDGQGTAPLESCGGEISEERSAASVSFEDIEHFEHILATSKLGPRQRLFMRLRFIEGLTVEEIAAAVCFSLPLVQLDTRKAFEKIRRKMLADGYEPVRKNDRRAREYQKKRINLLNSRANEYGIRNKNRAG